LTTALVACGSGTAIAASTPNLSSVTLTVATYSIPEGSDQLLLKSAGLLKTPYKLKFVFSESGGTQTQEVNAGTADLSRGSGVGNALIIGGGGAVNFKSIATVRLNTVAQGTLVKAGITSIAQLKGQQIAYTPDSTAQYVLLKQLSQAGLTMSDITPVSVDPATGLSALLSGQVAALTTFGYTSIEIAESHGFVLLPGGSQILKGSLGALDATWNANTASLRNSGKRAAIADYVARVDAAWAWTRAHAQQWDKIIAAASQQPVSSVAASFKASEDQVNSSDGPVVHAGIVDEQNIADTFQQAGVITQKPDVAATFSDQLNPAITLAIKQYRAKYPAWFAATKVQ
jgi:sulfonate transport system substrate-binding protein